MKKVVLLQRQKQGALAQLARALAWHARGHRFDSVMLHKERPAENQRVFCFLPFGVPFVFLFHPKGVLVFHNSM